MSDAKKTNQQLLAELDSLRTAHHELELRMQERTAELERANAALQASEERYRGIVENANDIMATITQDGVITGVNRAAEIMLGWSKDEVIGRNYRHFVTPASTAFIEDRIRQFFLGTKFHTNIEIEIFRKDGGTVLFECRTRPICAQDGRQIGFQIVYRDITTRKQEEEKLWQAKEAAEAANKEKSEFLSTMSHELRTPLQVVLGYADLLLSGAYGVLEEQQRAIIRKVDKNAHSLLDLITGVLDFNRLEAGRMPIELTEVNVAELVRSVNEETQGLREFSELEFALHVEDGLPHLNTDGEKLKVVIKNLLSNAIKFTVKGKVTITAYRQQNNVIISVADTGIGIPEERQTLIFEAFRKGEGEKVERYDGVGLGLHIAKRLLNLLGGTIVVESEVGRGSTFHIWMPLGESAEKA
jgi:two-component system sensor histidine kinase/response regulator